MQIVLKQIKPSEDLKRPTNLKRALNQQLQVKNHQKGQITKLAFQAQLKINPPLLSAI